MNGLKADPDIKLDPDAGTPSGSGYMDDDFFEDTGEMSMPPKGVDKDIWLTRVPDWLHEKISKWENFADGNDDDEIEIGEILYLPDPQRPGQLPKDPNKEVRLFFNDKWAAKSKLPRGYKLEYMNNKDPALLKSTYVFTEKDLPGYKPTGWGYGRGNQGNFSGTQDPKARIQKRTKFRKAIPKQTSLVGCATREYSCNPLDTKEFNAFQRVRTRHAIQGNHTSSNIVAYSVMQEVELGNQLQKAFKGFIKPAVAPKTQLNKAARIPKNELIDQLHQIFDRWEYCPMKFLKKETKQPEAYLKEVLGDIAQLVKSGSFASNYKRIPMYDQNILNRVGGKPPDMDDSDDEAEMEDVV
jgi:transcription initiation factor TFIIF subunit beta